MFTFLYQIIISPLQTILEVCYLFLDKLTDNKGISIIGLSFIVTLCTLPLYIIAEKWQNEERAVQNKLKNGVERIKHAFKGDEQYMILSTYYKQNHYHPLMALRSSFSLMVQIPFFIAAYNFISHLEPLKGVSFWFIKDFGMPDALFTVKGFAINILPIAMTLINCISGAIYSKGHPLREKIQIYVVALVFLVLLYNSPAALVLYWTMNNVLSLVKNVFYKFKNPKKAFYITVLVFCFLGIIADIFILKNTKTIFRLAFLFTCVFIPFCPFILKFFANLINNNFKLLDSNSKLRLGLFLSSAFSIAILCGFFITSTLIESETMQFCYVDSYKSPFYFIFYTFCHALGFFVFWPSCFYFLFSTKTKKIMAVLFPVLNLSAVLNSIVFSGNYGPLQQDLLFMTPQSFFPGFTQFVINTLVLLCIFIASLLLTQKKPKILLSVLNIVIFSLTLVSVINFIKIQKTYLKMHEPKISNTIEPIYHLSKDKQNVILIMQDRLFIPYVDYAFETNENLRKSFSGFTFYKNTTSFGPLTMIGTPGLFGGYDYTPYEINKRTDKTLQQKHNEALLTLPRLFIQNNWNVTVSDLTYENYLEYPVTDMYKNDPEINRINVMGAYSDLWYKRNNIQKDPYYSSMIKRNFIWFAIFKIVPPILRTGIYGRNYWISYNSNERFSYVIDNYAPLDFLPELVDFSSDKSSFTIIENELTHEGYIFQAPDYTPKQKTDNSHFSGEYINNADYHTQIAALLRTSEFLEYLKANDLYDNTKIVIVSDHGIPADIPGYFENNGRLPFSPARSSATLLVKDFNSKDDFTVNMDFMTNADTPYLATKDIIENAKNPFTNNPLKVTDKQQYIKISAAGAESTRIRHNTQFNIKDSE